MMPSDPKQPDRPHRKPQGSGEAAASVRRLRFDAAHPRVPRPMRPRPGPQPPEGDQREGE